MPTYRYVALAHDGARVRAVAEAWSEPALAKALQAEGLIVLKVREGAAVRMGERIGECAGAPR